MIAYAEAATDGPAGMLAVMKVVHNRIADPRFADDACAVALEPGQFQPVGEQPALRRALSEPERRSLAEAVGATSRTARLRLVQAWRLAGAAAVWPARDPTAGALYFVNPRLMDPVKCPGSPGSSARPSSASTSSCATMPKASDRSGGRSMRAAGMGYAKSLPRTASR